MKKEFLVCFYGKASVNVSRLPAHRSGPPRLTDSSGFHQGEKTYMSAYRRTRERRPISPAANQQKGSRTLDVSPLSRYPRRTRAHQAWEQSNRRDRLNPDFLRACTHVLPCSSNKTSLTIPPGRPHTRSPGTRPVDAQKPREHFTSFIISCHGL